ncbi:MAG: ATP-binding protein [Desulfobacterales bacterium]|nr:ATP-binding protein [Desulfobacterales bacterium]
MSEKVKFVGRSNEFSRINELIENQLENQVICIKGDGGIGKTRLLQEVHERFINNNQQQQQMQIASGIIDFHDIYVQDMQNMNHIIAEMLGEKEFESYLQHQAEIYSLRRKIASQKQSSQKQSNQKRLKEKEQVLEQSFTENFNGISLKKKVILFFDTTDRLEEKKEAFIEDIGKIISRVKNVAILIAGRNAAEIGEELERTSTCKIEIIDLLPLPEKERELYLHEKERQIHTKIEDELAPLLLSLSEGRPILIDLAVEWRRRGIELSLDEIQQKKSDFERRLVLHVKDIQTPIDQLILMMSYIRPLNTDIISKFMNIEHSYELFNELKSYVFVKELPDDELSLHDEMERMIYSYVWPEVDPNLRRRYSYSELISEYLSVEINNLSAKIEVCKKELNLIEKGSTRKAHKKSIEIEKLENHRLWVKKKQKFEHTLITNIDEAFKIFEDLFTKATETSRFHERKQIFKKLQVQKERFSSQQSVVRDIYLNMIYMDEGNYENAKALCNGILQRDDISLERRLETLLQLGNIIIRIDKIADSIPVLKKAKDTCEGKNLPVWLIKSQNALGWAYLLMGNIKEAERYLRKARQLFYQKGMTEQEELKNVYGWISNNLAFVFSENTKTRKHAIDMAQSIITYWKSIQDDIGLGGGYHVLGVACYRNGLHEEALEAYQKALDIFKPLENNDWLGLIYSWRGALYTNTGRPGEAVKDLTKSLEICTKNRKAMTLYRLARAYMIQGRLKDAEDFFNKSLEHAKDIPDYRYWVLALGRLAMLAASQGYSYRLDDLVEMLKDFTNQTKNPGDHEVGLAYIRFAILAFSQNDIDQIDRITDLLKQGISKLTRYGFYANSGIIERLDEVEKYFSLVNPEIIRPIGRSLQEFSNQKEIEDIAYMPVTERMYEWANWKAEDTNG